MIFFIRLLYLPYKYVLEKGYSQNSRPYQEDRYCAIGKFNGSSFFLLFNVDDSDISFYAVFDGHGGSFCSQY